MRLAYIQSNRKVFGILDLTSLFWGRKCWHFWLKILMIDILHDLGMSSFWSTTDLNIVLKALFLIPLALKFCKFWAWPTGSSPNFHWPMTMYSDILWFLGPVLGTQPALYKCLLSLILRLTLGFENQMWGHMEVTNSFFPPNSDS